MTKFIGAIEPRMEVLDVCGEHVGRVDRQQGQDRIKLLKHDGGHRFLNWDMVDRVENGKVRLNLSTSELEKVWNEHPTAHIT